jgi:hypothetical protein
MPFGKYIRLHTRLLSRLGWPRLVKHLQHPTDIARELKHIPHPASNYLHRLSASGVPAPSSAAPWPITLKRQILCRGAHTSASHQFNTFLWEDMSDMVSKGFWTVLPFRTVQHYPHLKLAPCEVVPQRTRWPRPIMDYTFTQVNKHSAMLAPLHAMQFGSTFQRLLQRIAPTQLWARRSSQNSTYRTFIIVSRCPQRHP